MHPEIVIGLVILLSLIVWIVALVDVVRRRFPDPNTKLIWVLVVVLTRAIGAVIYLIVGRKNGLLPRQPGSA